MQAAALIISILAVLATTVLATRQARLSRSANSLPVLVDLFREHRGEHLTKARKIVFTEAGKWRLERGFDGIPRGKVVFVRDLMYLYDNLGAFVLHDIVDAHVLAAHLGGSVVNTCKLPLPLITSERRKRAEAGFSEPDAWQDHFEHLCAVMHGISTRRIAAERLTRRWCQIPRKRYPRRVRFDPIP